ncbi:MAG: elongation factor G [Clostridia bacterium]|nr:elongation factor G [Clostridia bacterium]
MKIYTAENIRNIAVAGHGGRGKTSLCEAMLYTAGASERLGKVADGNTVMDYDADEKKRRCTISTAVAPLEWNGVKINLLDTPGLFDFAGGLYEGVRAAESVLIVLAAGSDELDVGAEKAVKAANARGIAKIFAVTRCDAEHADFYKTWNAIKNEDEFKTTACPIVVPVMEGEKVKGYYDFLTGKAYAYAGGKATEFDASGDANVEELTEAFNEAIANTDEALMEKYFEGEPFTPDEIASGLKAGIASGALTPVFACSGLNLEAVDLLLNSLAASAPSAKDMGGEKAEDGSVIACDENGDICAVCFKTIADPFVGKMSFFKVVSGKLTADVPCVNSRTGESERMGKIITVRGGKNEDTTVIPAGDIGVVTKLSGTSTGDTLCSREKSVRLAGVDYVKPCLKRAIKVRKKGEEEKVASGLRKLMEEDPTISYYTDEETKEQVIEGLGEQHLDVIVAKLKAKFGVEIDLAAPRVAYRETIRATADVEGRHKKQTGGHGQFGDVWIRFEPYSGEEDFVFTSDEVVGGAVPKNFFPAVEKGLRECIAKGMIAGYPMVGIKAALHDGGYHPVDSSEMAFKTAASLAFKNAIPSAKPTILEPIGTLKAYMPGDNLGDIMSDVTKRRGRVLGMGPSEVDPKLQELEAEVPMAEMSDFPTVLRSVTAGRGYFTLEFARYEPAPGDVQQKVIEDAKKRAEEEDE